MLLTTTTAYINGNILPALIGIIEAGIVFRLLMKAINAQEKGSSFSEFIRQSRHLIVAAIIGVGIAGTLITIKKYFQ